MGQITNIYCKPLAVQLSKYGRTGDINDMGVYEREIVQPGKTFVGHFNKIGWKPGDFVYPWDGEDCFISCDNPDFPEYYANLPPEIKAKTRLPGVNFSGINFFVHSGVA